MGSRYVQVEGEGTVDAEITATGARMVYALCVLLKVDPTHWRRKAENEERMAQCLALLVTGLKTHFLRTSGKTVMAFTQCSHGALHTTATPQH